MTEEVLYAYQVRYATTKDGVDMEAITVNAISLLEAVVLARQRVETRTDGFYDLLSVRRLRRLPPKHTTITPSEASPHG